MRVMVSSLWFVTALCSAQVTSFEDSVYNFKNSPYNFENSQYNFKNSAANFDNNPANPYAPNAVFDAQGNRAGYTTTTPQGVRNYYDNSGTRQGYSTR